MPALADVVGALQASYDPATAQDWDAVGLVVGDPTDDVRRVLFAVDPVDAVVQEALEWGAQLLVTHHPLFLRPVHGMPATSAKGALAHRLVRGGCALFVAHTNADSANPGVSDALAAAIGLVELEPLQPLRADPLDKVVVFVPVADAQRLLDALAGAGAGRVGAYDRAAWSTTGEGTFRPGPGSSPAIGQHGVVERVVEVRLEMVLPRARRRDVVQALRAAHPYEEPAFDLLELADDPTPGRVRRGIGRVGTLPDPLTVAALVHRVARALPPTAAGVRAAGDPERLVSRVAVCGGAGDSLFPEVRASGADAYVTADLRHHPASEALQSLRAPALVDVSHWASEWPWLADAARLLRLSLRDGSSAAGRGAASAGEGTTVETRVSTLCTDPWTVHSAARPVDTDGSSR